MSTEVTDINEDILKSLIDAIAAADVDEITHLLEDQHPADIAHLLESLPAEQRNYVLPFIPPEYEGEVLIHLNDDVRHAIIAQMDPEALLAATESLETDDLADILPDIPQDVSQELLLSMENQDRERLRAVLSYPDDSAGGLMDMNTIMVRADVTLDVVFRYLRSIGEIPDTTDSLFVVDRDGVFQGTLSLHELLIHPPNTLVDMVMDHDSDAILATTSATEVATLFERRDLVTAPVVDENKKLLGRITIDDVVDVIRETADHSFMSMAGLHEDEDLFSPVVKSTRRRSLWLGINLITALLASWVIGLFDLTIKQLVELAILMPVVASMGGIAGSQTLTLVIRGMALGQISKSNARRLLRKEVGVGIWNGCIWAVVVGIVAELWFDKWYLSLIIGVAILVNLIIAAMAGAVIPLILKKYNADPALSGSVVLTTVTDVAGFFVFLGLATLFLI